MNVLLQTWKVFNKIAVTLFEVTKLYNINAPSFALAVKLAINLF